MKKFFITVLSIAVIAMVGYGVKYALAPLNTQRLKYMTQENFINTNGFIIRDEWVMYSRSSGTVYHSVSEGDRVAKDSRIGLLFYGDVAEDSIKELTVVDNKIKKASAETDEYSVESMDETTIENNIYRRENNIIDAAAENDIISITQYKNDINSIRESNSLAAGDSLTEFENQKQQILSTVGIANEDITAQIAGVFTKYVDGYETQLVPEDIDSYGVAYFESLSQSPQMQKIGTRVEAGGAAFKIVNNHVWYVMMDIPADTMKKRKAGDNVKLRFNNMADAVVKGSINAVSEESNGRVVVTVKCPQYLESALSYRFVDVDLIFESFDGYRVPTHAIRTDADGKQKVIGINSNKKYDCYCDVLFADADGAYAIVDSSEDAENKLSQMERIVVGER